MNVSYWVVSMKCDLKVIGWREGFDKRVVIGEVKSFYEIDVV